jgi:rRNA maturation RNase YbeY
VSEGQPLTLELSLDPGRGAVELADEPQLRSLAYSILEAEGALGAWEIAVAFLGDDELQSLHLQFMGVDEPTDIMTFPYGDGTPGGDLAISADHAFARAAEWRNSPAEEIQFLVAHGVLHLLGWQDTRFEQRELMLARQEELVSQWRAADCP